MDKNFEIESGTYTAKGGDMKKNWLEVLRVK